MYRSPFLSDSDWSVTVYPVLPRIAGTLKHDFLSSHSRWAEMLFRGCCLWRRRVGALVIYTNICILRSSRLRSKYICNILMRTDRCSENDFMLHTLLKESNFHSDLLYCFISEIIAICNSQCCSIIHTCNCTVYVLGSTCLHCKSNRMALKYFTFTKTLAKSQP